MASNENANASFDLNKWLTTDEVAQYLRVSKGHVLNLVSQGKLRPHKFGNKNLYLIREVESLVRPPEIWSKEK